MRFSEEVYGVAGRGPGKNKTRSQAGRSRSEKQGDEDKCEQDALADDDSVIDGDFLSVEIELKSSTRLLRADWMAQSQLGVERKDKDEERQSNNQAGDQGVCAESPHIGIANAMILP
jgi:hypothetical protein